MQSVLPSALQRLLDALPGTAALVDTDGIIVAVNNRWLAFGLAQGAARESLDVGTDYFAACAPAGRDLDAVEVQRGLREILDRRREEFSHTYPCHSPQEQRWFRCTATPYEIDGSRLALILHVNVTESELRLRLLTELTGAALLELDASGNLVYATSAWAQLVPPSTPTAVEQGRGWLDAFDPADAVKIESALGAALRDQHTLGLHARLRVDDLPGGTERSGPDVRRVRIEGSPLVTHGMLTSYAVTVVESRPDPEESARLRNDALRDPLTRLLNRAGLQEKLAHAPATRSDVMLCLDLDGFKSVNDTGGHAVGDAVLNAVAARIRGSLRSDDVASRVGGDEFVLVLRDVTSAQAQAAAERLIGAIGQPIHAGGSTWSVGASVGLARGGDTVPLETVMARADESLLEAKSSGKNRATWYVDRRRAATDTSFAPPGDLFGHYHWHAGGHLVMFPGTEDDLVAEVCRYLLTGFQNGEAGLLCATKVHTGQIVAQLATQGADVEDLRASGQLVVLDAEDTVAQFMRDGRPDAELYRSAIGDRVQAITEQWPRVRAYGEMVAVLWAANNLSAAFVVEDLWNELTDELPFMLVCAYQPTARTPSASDVT
jgi:diguanylate cyclase (GGDEF)-like protein